MARCPLSKFVENAVPVGLLHLRVNVEARITQVGNFLREQFNAIHRVAEDNGLIDLQLAFEESEGKSVGGEEEM